MGASRRRLTSVLRRRPAGSRRTGPPGTRQAGSPAPGERSSGMSRVTEDDLTDEVVDRLARTPDPRLREVVTALVRHLHAFAKEVRLTDEEWLTGIRFLTATGQTCDDVRQEFILLSDTLGLSSLVDLINHADV